MVEIRRISFPMDRETARSLRAGDMVVLDGEVVVTAGLPTHHRLLETLRAGHALPRDLEGASIFHLGSLSREGPDGSFEVLYMNPTTSTRFNALMPEIIRRLGLTAVGGKGGLDSQSVAAMQEVGCVYLAFPGGACPLLSDAIEAVVAVDWPDLVSHYRLVTLKVRGLGPLTVGIDAHGRSLYDELAASARARLPGLLENLDAARPGSR